MDILFSFLIAITTGAACHYFIKWLDGNDTENQSVYENCFFKINAALCGRFVPNEGSIAGCAA